MRGIRIHPCRRRQRHTVNRSIYIDLRRDQVSSIDGRDTFLHSCSQHLSVNCLKFQLRGKIFVRNELRHCEALRQRNHDPSQSFRTPFAESFAFSELLLTTSDHTMSEFHKIVQIGQHYSNRRVAEELTSFLKNSESPESDPCGKQTVGAGNLSSEIGATPSWNGILAPETTCSCDRIKRWQQRVGSRLGLAHQVCCSRMAGMPQLNDELRTRPESLAWADRL